MTIKTPIAKAAALPAYPWPVRQIPNFLSAIRLATPLVALLAWYPATLHHEDASWVWLFIMAALTLTDAVDGKLARRLGVAGGRLGSALDHLSDKLTLAALLTVWQLLLWHTHLGSYHWSLTVSLTFCVAAALFELLVSLENLRRPNDWAQGATKWGRRKFVIQGGALVPSAFGLIGYYCDGLSAGLLTACTIVAIVGLAIGAGIAAGTLRDYGRSGRRSAFE